MPKPAGSEATCGCRQRDPPSGHRHRPRRCRSAAIRGDDFGTSPLLFAADGRLLFSGGITAARGHEGASSGQDELIAFLTGGEQQTSRPGIRVSALASTSAAAKEHCSVGKSQGRTKCDRLIVPEQLYRTELSYLHRWTDHLFVVLLLLQWAAGILVALLVSPRTWAGASSEIHPHVWAAVILGGVFAAFPSYLAIVRPGTTLTRYVIAVAQVLWSALLIHITGGRIESHFHVFGSLAFLAFYRDWRVLATATLVVIIDHLAGGSLAAIGVRSRDVGALAFRRTRFLGRLRRHVLVDFHSPQPEAIASDCHETSLARTASCRRDRSEKPRSGTSQQSARVGEPSSGSANPRAGRRHPSTQRQRRTLPTDRRVIAVCNPDDQETPDRIRQSALRVLFEADEPALLLGQRLEDLFHSDDRSWIADLCRGGEHDPTAPSREALCWG